ncbi:MinD/ParA family protein [Agromyces atrinae]|uniref:MinD/ParA family ATP-binding protein n=1 Tax=Agromyces atrinae TaxID=592376 RepID=UPI001F5723EF|nr:MinD/ParA family protein [Agromyces atrinae]MCI2958845.1 MinD/ParA family protein [Agromyces atrinae]
MAERQSDKDDGALATAGADEYVGELPTRTGAHLAQDLPESLTIQVDLPPAEREVPADEVAVAIDDVAINPVAIDGATSSTQSIELATPVVARSTYRQSAADSSPYGALLAADREPRRASSRVTSVDVDVPAGSLTPAGAEGSDALTAERLIEQSRTTRPAPTGGWNRFVYSATLKTVNLGDSPKTLAKRELDARIRRRFEGGARFVPVLTRKGGVGKTTITTLLGMALADARDDRIVAVDANPDRGTLAERVDRQTRATVRDVVAKAGSIGGFTDFSAYVSRDETRLDILASDPDPHLSEAFDADDYNVVASLAARYYSIVLTDCGTGIVHSVMRATLERADSVVIVSGGSVDEARLASETLTWLEANGFEHLVSNAIVAINLATQGTHLVKVDEIEAHFQSRVREIVRIPYDPQLAAGSVVHWDRLRPVTRHSARELAALVIEGIPVEQA